MNFNVEFVEKILSGEKTQTRRLVKEGEYEINLFPSNKIGQVIKARKNNVKKYSGVKWQIGKDYAVQSGRGKKGLWYCPKCKLNYEDNAFNCGCTPHPYIKSIPLRVVIKNIRKERLLDISEEDAKREGYRNKDDFVDGFVLINKGRPIYENLTKVFGHIVSYWNPSVWAIEFEVKK